MAPSRTYLTSTVVCLNNSTRVIFRPGVEAVGLHGKNVARDTADDSKVRWNGMGIVILKIRDAGK
jgi:hypothetical protein